MGSYQAIFASLCGSPTTKEQGNTDYSKMDAPSHPAFIGCAYVVSLRHPQFENTNLLTCFLQKVLGT